MSAGDFEPDLLAVARYGPVYWLDEVDEPDEVEVEDEPERCRSCDGDGLVECRECGGTGST